MNLLLEENKVIFLIRDILIEDIKEISSIHIQAWQETNKNIIDEEYLKELNLQDK